MDSLFKKKNLIIIFLINVFIHSKYQQEEILKRGTNTGATVVTSDWFLRKERV